MSRRDKWAAVLPAPDGRPRALARWCCRGGRQPGGNLGTASAPAAGLPGRYSFVAFFLAACCLAVPKAGAQSAAVPVQNGAPAWGQAAPSGVAVRTLPPALRDTLLRAQSALTSGATLEALQLYGRVLAVEPGNAYALAGRAAVYQKLGRMDEARRDLHQVMASGGDSMAVEASLALLAAAEGLSTEGRALRRDNIGAAYDAVNGHILAMTGDYEGAADPLARAVKASPESTTLLWNYAVVLDHLGRGQEAAASYRRVLASLPASDEAGRRSVVARLKFLAPTAAIPAAPAAPSAAPAAVALPAPAATPLTTCGPLPYGAFSPSGCGAQPR